MIRAATLIVLKIFSDDCQNFSLHEPYPVQTSVCAGLSLLSVTFVVNMKQDNHNGYSDSHQTERGIADIFLSDKYSKEREEKQRGI